MHLSQKVLSMALSSPQKPTIPTLIEQKAAKLLQRPSTLLETSLQDPSLLYTKDDGNPMNIFELAGVNQSATFVDDL